MKKVLLSCFLLLGFVAAHGQAYSPLTSPITASGGTLQISNLYGGYNVSFEEIPSGSPATVSVVVQGCMRGGSCDTAADTNTSTAAAIRFVTFTKAYNYFLVTASWTGGTNATIQVNPLITTARNGSSTGGAVASVFGRTGVVVAAASDYNFSQIAGTLSSTQTNRNMPEFMKGICQGCSLGGTAGVSIPGNFAATTGPTPYGLPGSSTVAGYGVPQFKNVGVFATGDSITYGPFIVPSSYTTNGNIVLHFTIADHVATTGTVTIGCSYADVTSPAVTQPTLFAAGYNTGAVTVSGTIDNSVNASCTLTPNVSASPAVTAGDWIWFSVWYSARSASATPYLTAYWSY